MNTFVSGCSACHKVVSEVVGTKKTRYDYALNSCAVCKCVLKAKVHFPLETLDRETKKLQSLYPEHCWLKKDGENYRGHN